MQNGKAVPPMHRIRLAGNISRLYAVEHDIIQSLGCRRQPNSFCILHFCILHWE